LELLLLYQLVCIYQIFFIFKKNEEAKAIIKRDKENFKIYPLEKLDSSDLDSIKEKLEEEISRKNKINIVEVNSIFPDDFVVDDERKNRAS